MLKRQQDLPFWRVILLILTLLLGIGTLSVFEVDSAKIGNKHESFSTTKAVSVEQIKNGIPSEVTEEVSVGSKVATCIGMIMQEVSPNSSEDQVVWTTPVGTANVFGVTFNAVCKPQIVGTSVHGKTRWELDSTVRTNNLSVSNLAELEPSSGSKLFGCEVSAKTDSNVNAICGDPTNADPIHIDGALKVGHSIGDRILVPQQPDVCHGIQVNAGVQNPDSSTCLEPRCISTNAGQIAAFRFRESILTWVSESQSISKDGGQSWQ